MNILTKLKLQIRLALMISCLLIPVSSFAQTLKVAAAANLQSVIKVLGADFTKRTGVVVEPIVGFFICRYGFPAEIICHRVYI